MYKLLYLQLMYHILAIRMLYTLLHQDSQNIHEQYDKLKRFESNHSMYYFVMLMMNSTKVYYYLSNINLRLSILHMNRIVYMLMLQCKPYLNLLLLAHYMHSILALACIVVDYILMRSILIYYMCNIVLMYIQLHSSLIYYMHNILLTYKYY